MKDEKPKTKIKTPAPIKARVRMFIKESNITAVAFCKKVGIGTPVIRQVYNEFTATTITRILQLYDNLSADWLLLGIGNMIRDKNPAILKNENEIMLPISEVRRITDEAQNSLRITQTTNSQLIAEKDKQMKEKDKRIKELVSIIKEKDRIINNHIEKRMK